MRRFDELLILICNYFNNNNIPYSIIGGVAVIFQGRFRTTEDIDLVILHEELEVGDFVDYCTERGLSIEEFEVIKGFEEKSHISILDLPNGLRIDLKGIYTEWDAGVVDTAEDYKYEGSILKIAKPEFLIANKLYKGGSIDIEDAFSVFVQNQRKIDLELLERISEQLEVKKSLKKFLKEIKGIEKTD